MPKSSYYERSFEDRSFLSPPLKADAPAAPAAPTAPTARYVGRSGLFHSIFQTIKDSGLGRFFVDAPPVCATDSQSRQKAEADQARALYKAMLDITSH